MKTIWKIALPLDVLIVSTTTEVRLPANSRLVHVREQKDALCAWFEVDPETPEYIYKFQVFGTGTPVGEHLQYLGTGLFADGTLVLHLYQVAG